MDHENHWSRFARDFEERTHYVAGHRNLDEIRRVLSALALSGRVLELGCGNGMHTRVVADTADAVVATDLSEDMVAAAGTRLADLPNVRVERQDAAALAYPDAAFDAVLMVNLLHVIPNRAAVLAESRRVLKADGQLAVVSFTTDGMEPMAKLGLIYRYTRAYGKRPKGAQALTVGGTRAMVEAAGFIPRDACLIGDNCKAVYVHAVTRPGTSDGRDPARRISA
ncbi:methyltransferase domain-containing protein [Roseospira visakhapatnamensis]|uniref:ABC-2 type transport system ATP-binding protein n=1 Tax=Roseospira visakhapatnamensis TaxID=390880 RepID=A0A7W6WAP4_9PROT|nr:ABC-2 type transport system ATP-binding protein [Roseospira visakhapatnamensis]